jgi:methyl-accepting chemotaxis protein
LATKSRKTAAQRPAAAKGAARGAGPGGGNGAMVAEADLEPLLEALRTATRGESGVRLDARGRGPVAQLAKAFNDLSAMREQTTDEIVRVATAIGREGKLTDRAVTKGTRGVWNHSLSAVNGMIDDLSRPTLEVARVIDAVADGDLSQKMQLKIEGRAVKGEFLRIGTTVNAMVDQLSSFADEVTRVAREVGTEGQLGGQANVKGVSGTWKDLTDNVNFMATNLTTQVRGIA